MDKLESITIVRKALVVVLETPEPFGAVAAFYEDFGQVSDEEVLRIMNKYRPNS